MIKRVPENFSASRFSLSWGQILAAIEVFGKSTLLIKLIHSGLIYGNANPDTVGKLADAITIDRERHVNFDKGRKNLIAIMRFYDHTRKLAAIGISPFSDDEQPQIMAAGANADITPDSEIAQLKFRRPLIPDTDIIFLTASSQGDFIKLKPLDLFGFNRDIFATVNIMSKSFPERSKREEMVEQVRQAVAKAAPSL